MLIMKYIFVLTAVIALGVPAKKGDKDGVGNNYFQQPAATVGNRAIVV